jgi:hypothetical protein
VDNWDGIMYLPDGPQASPRPWLKERNPSREGGFLIQSGKHTVAKVHRYVDADIVAAAPEMLALLRERYAELDVAPSDDWCARLEAILARLPKEGA